MATDAYPWQQSVSFDPTEWLQQHEELPLSSDYISRLRAEQARERALQESRSSEDPRAIDHDVTGTHERQVELSVADQFASDDEAIPGLGLTTKALERLEHQFHEEKLELDIEQRRKLFKHYFRAILGSRRPLEEYREYHVDLSDAQSDINGAIWPGEFAAGAASNAEKAHLDPVELSKRLRVLLPEENFVPRGHDPDYDISWCPTSDPCTPDLEMPIPSWLQHDRSMSEWITKYDVGAAEERLTAHVQRLKAIFLSPVLRRPVLLHQRTDEADRTYNRFLIKGLDRWQTETREELMEVYEKEFQALAPQQKEILLEWERSHPEKLKKNLYNRVMVWPDHLRSQLFALDEAAVQKGTQIMSEIWQKAEAKMSELIAFWQSSGAIYDRHESPSFWLAPLSCYALFNLDGYAWPKRLTLAIDSAMEQSTGDEELFKRLCVIAAWKTEYLQTGKEPHHPFGFDRFQPSLLVQLRGLWKKRVRGYDERLEDEFMEAIRSHTGPFMTSPRGRTRKRTRTTRTVEPSQTAVQEVWSGRLRQRLPKRATESQRHVTAGTKTSTSVKEAAPPHDLGHKSKKRKIIRK